MRSIRIPALPRMLLLLALLFTASNVAHSQTWWRPSAQERIALHYALQDPLDVTNAVEMGLRDFQGNALPAPDVYVIDGDMNSAATVAYLHSIGKKVICYIDAGAYETYREDAHKFEALTPQIWGKPDAGWEGSYWLDVRRVTDLEPIMRARMQMCKDKGFDAIDPDEINGWENDTGFPITYQDQLVYNKALARWAHEIGMSIGQKGDITQTRDLVDDFDWTINEECFQYRECTSPYDPILDAVVPGLQLYVQQDKAVFILEYASYKADRWNSICERSSENRFNTTRFKLGLPNRGRRLPCSTARQW